VIRDGHWRVVAGNTALCSAIAEKHVEVVRLLVEAGTDLNKPPSPRRPPLTIAIDQASKEITEILCYGTFTLLVSLILYMDRSIKYTLRNLSLMLPTLVAITLSGLYMTMSEYCCSCMSNVMTTGGADINQRDLLERTPLMHAIAEDSPMNSLESRRMSLQRATKCNGR
jgi:ankyrin repeat protein